MSKRPISAEIKKQITKRLNTGEKPSIIIRDLKVSAGYVYKLKGKLKVAAETKKANYKAAGIKAAQTRAANRAAKLTNSVETVAETSITEVLETSVTTVVETTNPAVLEINSQISLRESQIMLNESEISTLRNTLSIINK